MTDWSDELADSRKAITDWYCDALKIPRDIHRIWPHCDALVLHAPYADCDICNLYAADLQQLRITSNMNFTGEYDIDRWPDPATMSRPEEIINRWRGNVQKRLSEYE